VYDKYTWDGEKWGITPTAAGGGITQADADLRYVDVAGDTMTGHLTLPTTPAAANAVRKDYVDTAVAGTVSQSYVDTQDALRLLKTANLSDVANVVTSRQNIYAAPFDAMAYSGMQINGGMEINQELGVGNTSSSSGSVICDNWTYLKTGTMVVSSGMALSAPLAPGLPAVLYSAVSTAQPSLGASDYSILHHRIEGYRVARLAWGTANALPITIGFWTAHHRTGVYSITASNGAGNRSYCAAYTQAVADVSQYNIVTIPGCTDGTWLTTNGIGIVLAFPMASGAALTAPTANTWLSTGYQAAPGQVNAVAATSDVFRISGLIVLPGIEAPSAARSPLIMRPYDQELVTCQRYLQKIGFNPEGAVSDGITGAQHIGNVVSSTAITVLKQFFRPMRSNPAVTFYRGANGVTNGRWSFYNGAAWVEATSMAINTIDNNQVGINMTFAGGLATGNAFTTQGGALFDARL
jgi:hypothetical protein